MKTEFQLQVSPGGVYIYHHVENGKKRMQLMDDFRAGKITQQEMRDKAKKIKYLFSEKDLPKDYIII